MSVVTIYCCGTGEDRDKTANIVPATWGTTCGDRSWINDGPGNGNAKYAILKSEHILETIERGSKLKKGAFGSKNTSSAKGNLGGVGTQDNIINTIQWLWFEYYRLGAPPITAINLCGWSRGAVTCIMLAHAIEEAGFREKIPALKVNIFAIDPVPGGANDFGSGNFDKTGRTGSPDELSACVGEYQAVLAENVGGAKGSAFRNCSPTFKGQGPGGRKMEFPLPGTHSDVAKLSGAVGKLSVSLCHRFLTSHGTELAISLEMTEAEELEQFAIILLEHGKFSKGIFRREPVFKKWDVAFERRARVENKERAHRFFVNSYHAVLFQRALPLFANYINTPPPKSISGSQIADLRSRYPNTWQAMVNVGYLNA